MKSPLRRDVPDTVGDSAMESDHHALIQLLQDIDLVCRDNAESEGSCDSCPRDNPVSCHEALGALCRRMQDLLLEHFKRESELMSSLSKTASAKSHCTRHRLQHVYFSTHYNKVVAGMNAARPSLGASRLEAFVLEWIGTHALEFDAELADLLKHPLHTPQS